MIILLKLIFAHLIGDFLLQPKSWVLAKENNKLKSFKFYLHALLHGILIVVVFWDITLWLLACIITALHALFDAIKLYFQNDKNKPIWFFIDQILHLASIVIIWYLWFKPDMAAFGIFLKPIFLLFTTAAFFLTKVCSIIIQKLLISWSADLPEEKNNSLLNAGKYIGALERIFVFVFVITGNWQATGFLIAAKSVFRFGDLKESKDRKLTEYILIGTLLSFGIAMLSAILFLKIKKYFL